MLIDWFTVVAQIINFLILVLLLRRFLYGPIIRAMDQREARLAKEHQAAQDAKAEAEAAAADYQNQRDELAARREELLRQAQDEAEARRHELIKEVRRTVDQQRERWEESLANEQVAFLQDLRRKASHATLELSRRALRDLADQELGEGMAAAFARQLAQTSTENWERLLQSAPLTLASAHPLEKASQDRIRDLVTKQDADAELRFEVEPELGSGMELRSPTHKISWTLAGYLDELEEEFARALGG